MREPTDEMILAGAKAIADQLDEKGEVWDRGLADERYKLILLKAAKHAWLAMEAARPIQLTNEAWNEPNPG